MFRPSLALTNKNNNVLGGYMPNNCLPSINPDKQRAHNRATFNIYYSFRKDLHDVALAGANPHREEKDLIREVETLA